MKIFRRIFWLMIYLVVLMPMLAWGRAGGSGGGSGGSHSSMHSSMHYNTSTNTTNGTPISLPSLIILIVIFILLRYIFRLFKDIQKTKVDAAEAAPASEISLSDEQQSDLKNKVELAFLTIQKAWSEKQLMSMRRFISDGVYQRFNAQFKMMNILEQEDIMSDVKVLGINFVKYTVEGNYECVDVKIRAYAKDQFRSKKFPQFNSPGGGEEFAEYWSFIRRKDCVSGKDIFSSENCPKCSAPLNEKLLETARCSYCGAYLNNGEYDWVLCEITEEEDYQSADLAPALQKQTEDLLAVYPAFSRHLLEDIASNAFLQILIAKSTGEADVLHRFCTDAAFSKIKQYVKAKNIVYDRLYLTIVELSNLSIENNIVRARVNIEYCSLMVEFENNGSAHLLSEDVGENPASVVLMRELSGEVSKGSIFANACSKCGATQADSLSAVCAYCASPLNDPKRDWIIDDFSSQDLTK
jgi:hypothetical protein